MMKWNIEDTAGASSENVPEGWIDGWDAVNVRISIDSGDSWHVLESSNHPYDFYSGYGWLYNGEKEGENGTHSLASGWSGSQDWHLVTFDLNNYKGETVIIRFAFGSDPMYSTWSDLGFLDLAVSLPELSGVFIDDICGFLLSNLWKNLLQENEEKIKEENETLSARNKSNN